MEALLGNLDTNKYDMEAWQSILRLVYSERIENFRENVYERLVDVFPTSGKFWKIYIEHEASY